MKMKWKGRISLWLACVLILVALPASVSADTQNINVRVYTGASKVKPEMYVSADTGTYGQVANPGSPDGYIRDGWRMWRLDEHGCTVSSCWVGDDESSWPSSMAGYFAPENIVLAPNWVPQYSANAITAENPTVVIGDGTGQDSLGLNYEWLREYKVVDANTWQENAGQIKVLNSNATYSADGRWGIGGELPYMQLELELQAGDVVIVKNITGGTNIKNVFSGYLKDSVAANYLEPVDHNNDTFSVTASSSGSCILHLQKNAGAQSLQASITVRRAEQSGSKTYSGPAGNYCCRVSYSAGGQNVSFLTNAVDVAESVKASEYALAKSDEVHNGSYALKINGQEVTSAAPGQTVTVETYADKGYKLNIITYRKKGDNNDVPNIVPFGGDGNGCFVMPEYDVLVEVTFQKDDSVVDPDPGTDPDDPGTKPDPDDPGTKPDPDDPGTKPDPDDPGTKPDPDDPGTKPDPDDPGTKPDPKPELPEIEIGLSGTQNMWSSFFGNVSFNLMFGKAQSLTIKVTEAEGAAGKSSTQYYLANENLFQGNKTYTPQEIETVLAGKWKSDADTIALTSDGRYVLYVKATDSEGNAAYANSQGIVIDTTAPVISGVKNGNAYYGVTKFTIQDAYLNAVTVDGKNVQPGNGVYTIQPDNAMHEIVAEDRMGNKVSCKITVYETWVRDGIKKSGVYALEKGTAYKLGKGKWKIIGDNTIYQGGTTIYVSESGDYDFRKQ